MDNFYKKTAKKLNALLLICNELFPIINDNLLENQPSIDIIRSYSVYATSLNLLVSYCVAWSYNRKKLQLLMSSKSKSRAEIAQKICDKLISLSSDAISQFTILTNVLSDFSKKFDKQQKEGSTHQNYSTVAAFLQKEISTLKKIDLAQKNKALISSIASDTKTGGYEGMASSFQIHKTNLHKQLNDIYGAEFEDEISSKPSHPSKKVTIGGYDYSRTDRIGSKEVYLGGLRNSDDFQNVKSALIKIQMLREDLQQDQDSSYYDNVFLEKVAEILQLIDFSASSADFPQTLLKFANTPMKELFDDFLKKNPPDSNFKKQISAIINSSSISNITKYYTKRTGKVIAFNEKIEPTLTNILDFVQRILTEIDSTDAQMIYDVVDEEFAFYETIKSTSTLTKAVEELGSNIKLIEDKKFAPNARHDYKAKIKDYFIFSTMDIKIELIINKSTIQDIDETDISKKMESILNLLQHVITIRASYLALYQKIKDKYDNDANQLRKLFMTINEMIAPENTATCIKKPALLIKTLIRANLLPKIAKKRKLKIDSKICDDIKTKLIDTFSIKLDKKLYSKKGLKELPKLIKQFIN